MRSAEMNPLFLMAEHHNWGLTKQGDWKKTIFRLSYSRYLEIYSFYDEEPMYILSQLSDAENTEILTWVNELIKNPIDEDINVCDGDAWEFKAYSEKGKKIYERKLGYIHHIDLLEKIAAILETHEPDRVCYGRMTN